MAKKNKKQKAGMLKRRKQKKVKKEGQRKRSAVVHAPQQPQNEKELHKLLSRIPILAYESELNELRFDQDTLKDLLASEREDPRILIELLSPEFIQTCETNLNEMAIRVEGQVQKALMVKGVLYALENQQMPHFVNPLITAIYLKTKAEIQDEPIEAAQILKAVAEYEKDNMELLEQLIEEETKEAEDLSESDEPIEDFAPVKESQIDESLLKTYYDSLSELAEEEQERLQEDLEVFLDDYVTIPMAEWNADLLDDFLGTWFIKNLNPMEEDLVSVQKSLEHFFQFLADQEKIGQDESQKILKLLQDEETYKQRMSA